ncbi:MAG: cysteine peptidase family C39 domain-containing protein, partial [Verrucomicrobiota bacterium]
MNPHNDDSCFYPDALLNALMTMGKLYGRPVDPAGATAGLPLKEGRLTPQLLIRAAQRCGFDARVVKRPLDRLSGPFLPAILITGEDSAMVLCSRTRNRAKVIMSDTGGGGQEIAWKHVKKAYTGVAILIKPIYEFEDRGDFKADRKPRSWFWGTLWRFRGLYARVAVATVVINLFAVTSSLFIMNVYDRVVPNRAVETLWMLAIGAGIAYVFEFLLKSLRTFFVDRAGHRADLLMGSWLFEQVLGMHYSKRPSSAGALASQARAYENLRE